MFLYVKKGRKVKRIWCFSVVENLEVSTSSSKEKLIMQSLTTKLQHSLLNNFLRVDMVGFLISQSLFISVVSSIP